MEDQDYGRSRLLGYPDRLSARQGQALTFFVSAPKGTFQAEVRRLISVDDREGAGGIKHELVPSKLSERYTGKEQRSAVGCHAEFTYPNVADVGGELSVAFSFRPTVLPEREEVLVSFNGNAAASKISINDRRLGLVVGGETIATSDLGLSINNWYRVVLAIGAKGTRLSVGPLSVSGRRGKTYEASSVLGIDKFFPAGFTGIVSLAAELQQCGASGHFNGKIGEVELCSTALSDDSVARILDGDSAKSIVGTGVISSWSMGRNTAPMVVPNDVHGGPALTLVNLPMRAVTGSRWTGRQDRAELTPDEYNAILFHDDMVEGGDWEPSLDLQVLHEWRSGIYALRISDGTDEDWIPFYVRPATGAKHARVAFLAPTNTYVAYGNETNSTAEIGDDLTLMKTEVVGPQDADKYVTAHPELGASLYDNHKDGAGVAYVSRLRPLLNFRPFHFNWLNNSYRHFGADFYLIDWLEHFNFEYDVLTDDDLHSEGVAALKPYTAIITGSHPEYFSERMLDATTEYVDTGGKLMYLGGNGFYWATSYHPDKPHVIEVRRGFTGARNWTSPPGETSHAFTGEPGGLWRNRGRSPHRLTGIGMGAVGWAKAGNYKRVSNEESSQFDWVFEGVTDELIGTEGMMLGGAVGDEIDHIDYAQGTPPETIVIGSSVNLSHHFQPVIEYYTNMLPDQGGSQNPLVRADMTWLPREGGGVVFSVGSICWTGCLPINGYDNSVSRITMNVLSNFIGN